jgi:hypothetical protein
LNEVYARLVHEPNQAECCNHALIPLCNTPTIINQNFWVNFSQMRNLQKLALAKCQSLIQYRDSGFWIFRIESPCPLESPITDGTNFRCVPFSPAPSSVLEVHVTCVHMTTVICFCRGFFYQVFDTHDVLAI